VEERNRKAKLMDATNIGDSSELASVRSSRWVMWLKCEGERGKRQEVE